MAPRLPRLRTLKRQGRVHVSLVHSIDSYKEALALNCGMTRGTYRQRYEIDGERVFETDE